ncbi:MAG: hypothetical protein AAGD07_02425 [Planctomycetota bacterium]
MAVEINQPATHFQIRHLFSLTFVAALVAASAKAVGFKVTATLLVFAYVFAPLIVFLLVCIPTRWSIQLRFWVGTLLLSVIVLTLVCIGALTNGGLTAFGIPFVTAFVWMLQALAVAPVYAVWRSGIQASQRSDTHHPTPQERTEHDSPR